MANGWWPAPGSGLWAGTGETWGSHCSVGAPYAGVVYAVANTSEAPRTIYAGTVTDWVLRSDDDGRTFFSVAISAAWTCAALAPPPRHLYAIAHAHRDPTPTETPTRKRLPPIRPRPRNATFYADGDRHADADAHRDAGPHRYTDTDRDADAYFYTHRDAAARETPANAPVLESGPTLTSTVEVADTSRLPLWLICRWVMM
ncbi:MAG: hypothetical protein R3A44_39200 [Caldilineaceae bacterium]